MKRAGIKPKKLSKKIKKVLTNCEVCDILNKLSLRGERRKRLYIEKQIVRDSCQEYFIKKIFKQRVFYDRNSDNTKKY